MTSIFEVTDSLLSKRNQGIIDKPDVTQAITTPYMLQRWLTMTNEKVAYIINESTNKLWQGLTDDKLMWYKLLNVVTPQTNIKPVYIKKQSATINKEKEKALDLMAEKFELSKRELREAHKMFKFNINQYKEVADKHE